MKLTLILLFLSLTVHAQYTVTASRYVPANDVTLVQIRFDCGKSEKIAVFMCKGSHVNDSGYVLGHGCLLNHYRGVEAFHYTEWHYVKKKDEIRLKGATGLKELCNL